MTVKKLRAALYARVSGDDRGREGRNLEGQLDLCREHAKKKGWLVVEEIAEDASGASGAAMSLPGLDRILDLASQGAFDVLVCREMDRLARTLVKQLVVERELSTAGVRVEYVLGDYPDTLEGSLSKNVRAVIAEYERLKIKERMTRGRRQKARSGQVVSHGIRLFGYEVVQQEGRTTMAIVEEEAATVRLIFSLYLEGHSTYAIQKRLTEMRVPTPADRGDYLAVTKKRGAGEWSRSTVNRIVNREEYTGFWLYGKSGEGEPVRVPIPPIVDRETWLAAQERKRANKQKPKNVKHQYLLGGRLRCAACGASAKSIPVSGKSHWLYYRCGAAAEKAAYVHKCDQPHFRADKLDQLVWDWLLRVLEPESFEENLELGEEMLSAASEPLARRLASIETLMAEAETKLERAVAMYVNSPQVTAELFRKQQDQLVATLEGLRAEREEIERELAGVGFLTKEEKEELKMAVAELAGASLDFAGRRRVIEKFEVRGRLEDGPDGKCIHASCLVASERLCL